MKKNKYIFLLFCMCNIAAFSFEKKDILSIDFIPTFDLETDGNIYHAYGWFEKTSTAIDFNFRLKVSLMYGLKPFLGYHYMVLFDNGEKAELWENIYRIDAEKGFNVQDYVIDTHYSGPTLGIIWDLFFLSKYYKPYIIFQMAQEDLTAKTFVYGYGPSYYTSYAEEFVGHSYIDTEKEIGYKYGVGFSKSYFNFDVMFELSYSYTRIGSLEQRYYLEGPGVLKGGGMYSTFVTHQICSSFIKMGIGISYSIW